MNQDQKLVAGAAVAVGLFCAANILGGSLFQSVRVDLTEDRLYTLSAGAKEIARGLDEPVRIQFYASESLRDESPSLASVMKRVDDVLDEFVRASGGKLVLERLDPLENSEAEDDAELAGLQRIALGGGGREGYFGLVLRNSVGEREVLPTIQPSEETLLEYQIAQRLVALDAAKKPVIGLLTSLPVDGAMPMAPNQRPTPEWRILTELRRQFDVRRIATDAERIDADVDVLFLLHPSDLGIETLYAIDQYTLRGGPVLALVDPFCAVDESGERGGAVPASYLEPLLANWGLTMDQGVFAADRIRAERDGKGTPLLFWLLSKNEDFDRTDPVAARLSDVLTFAPGVLHERAGRTTEVTSLLRTTAEAAAMSVYDLMSLSDAQALVDRFDPGFEPLMLAARVRGPLTTAFPKGPVATDDPLAGSASEGAGDDGANEDVIGPVPIPDLPAGHLAASTSDFVAIVIADADMVHDRQWLQMTVRGPVKTSENIDFVFNALEQLTGGDQLIALRARGTFDRPFEKLRELRLVAQERYQEEIRRLERQLEDVDARIEDIVRAQGDGNTVLLTDELQDELRRDYAARDEARKQLRRVKFDLAREERSLGTLLKWIDIAAVPLLVVAAGVVLLTARRRSRDAH